MHVRPIRRARGTIDAMSSPRRPAAPGSGRRPGRDEAPSGSVPRAARTTPGRSSGSSTAPRGVRSTAPRSGAVPKVGTSRPGAARNGPRTGSGRGGTPPRGTPRAPATRLPVPRMFTVRAMVFTIVVLVAFVLVYPTLGSYLETRAEVEQLRAARDAARAENADLEADLRRWDDDAYVVAQARERLSFVMPGETAFRVVDPEVVPDTTAPDSSAVPLPPDGSTRPWYATVWESVQVAGDLDVDGTRPQEPADGASTSPATDAGTGPGADPAG